MKGEVISPFRDKFHFNILYEVGAIVDFDEERMNSLIERKLCKKVEVQDENSASPKAEDKEPKKTPKKKVVKEKVVEDTPKETLAAEEVDDELDEKAKSEQEAAQKIAEATGKVQK